VNTRGKTRQGAIYVHPIEGRAAILTHTRHDRPINIIRFSHLKFSLQRKQTKEKANGRGGRAEACCAPSMFRPLRPWFAALPSVLGLLLLSSVLGDSSANPDARHSHWGFRIRFLEPSAAPTCTRRRLSRSPGRLPRLAAPLGRSAGFHPSPEGEAPAVSARTGSA
jgi:hypothetical protein